MVFYFTRENCAIAFQFFFIISAEKTSSFLNLDMVKKTLMKDTHHNTCTFGSIFFSDHSLPRTLSDLVTVVFQKYYIHVWLNSQIFILLGILSFHKYLFKNKIWCYNTCTKEVN